MTALTNTKVRGYRLVDSWNQHLTNDAVTGVRVYIDTDVGENTIFANFDKVDIPTLDDIWDVNYPTCVVTDVDVTYFGESEDCGRLFTITYSTDPQDEPPQESTPTSAEDLPTSMDVGGEFTSFTPSASASITWSDGTTPVKIPIVLQTPLGTIRLHRVIKSFDDYMKIAMGFYGRVNSTTFRNVWPIETVMFKGCSASQFTNRAGEKRWNVELVFMIRSVTHNLDEPAQGSTALDGWNFKLNPKTGLFERPTRGGNGYPYIQANFNTLFTADPLGDGEDQENEVSDE